MADKWYIDENANNGYPYIDEMPLTTAATKIFEEPKPWWVWKINEEINDGYPYITFNKDYIPPEPIKERIYIKYVKVSGE